MSAPARCIGAFFLALWAALALFWVMTALIRSDGVGLGTSRKPTAMNFIRFDDRMSEVRQRQRERPKPPEKPQQVPQVEPLPAQQTSSPQAPALDMAPPQFQPSLARSGLPTLAAPGSGLSGPVAYSLPLTPVSQIPPVYPRRAMLEGISGWVRLSFIIAEDGSVRDIEVVEASPRRGIFDHEAIRALSRWQFNPQLVDGKAVPATATITITFNLER